MATFPHGAANSKLYEVDGISKQIGAVVVDACGLGSPSCPNFWIPKDVFGGELQHVVESIVAELYHSTMKILLPENFSGVEWWLQTYEGGRGLGFHFDKDEHVMAERGVMQHPLLSSILYLTGTSASPRQAPTVVLQQVYDSITNSASPEDPAQCVVVFPLVGNMLVFDGALGHGVLDAVSSDVRMTLLINWWDHRPETVKRLTPEDISKYGLSAWVPDTLQPEHAMHMRQIENMAQLNVHESEDPIQQIDDLLADASITISGDAAVHWVGIRHDGLALYPTADQLRESGTVADCCAAFVPLSMLGGSEASDSSDEES